MENLIFGPVPSRRLGKSLGVNNIPHKYCSYACGYCQIGTSVHVQPTRREFFSPKIIIEQIKKRIDVLNTNELPDYITIVPDGEPTLDINLHELLSGIKNIGIPVAIITNGSLMDSPGVMDALLQADYVSVKVDAVDKLLWGKINSPDKHLKLDSILNSISYFSSIFKGALVTETMLINNLNDSLVATEAIATYLKTVHLSTAFISIPTRPTSKKGFNLPTDNSILRTFDIFTRNNIHTELLIGYEGNAFATTGNFQNDLLSITSVHPMRKEAVIELMLKTHSNQNDLTKLIKVGAIKEISYDNQIFYLRQFKKQPS